MSIRWLVALSALSAQILVVASASAQTLTLSAAASLTNVLKSVGAAYEVAHPGLKLQVNFAASGVLLQQIAQGAPVDVFISADEATVQRGIGQQLFDAASRRDIATNHVVLIVPASGGAMTRLSDLRAGSVRRIAIGKPASVPVGRYTRQALEAAGLWSVLEPRFVQADSARQVLDYVARGEVEAGFVYATDAAVMADKVRVVTRVEGHAPVRYPAVRVSDSRQKAAAEDFLAYLLTPPAQALLAKAGFGKP
jgi:molybdate transport system substrate-binding protein